MAVIVKLLDTITVRVWTMSSSGGEVCSPIFN